MRYLFISLLTIFILYVFSVVSFAGRDGNTGANGNVTAIILCENGDSEDITVDHAQLAINADGCKCEIQEPDWPETTAVDCDNDSSDDDHCTECLASLQTAGMSIISSNSFLDDEEEKMQFVLTGNAGPFMTRAGGCICD